MLLLWKILHYEAASEGYWTPENFLAQVATIFYNNC